MNPPFPPLPTSHSTRPLAKLCERDGLSFIFAAQISFRSQQRATRRFAGSYESRRTVVLTSMGDIVTSLIFRWEGICRWMTLRPSHRGFCFLPNTSVVILCYVVVLCYAVRLQPFRTMRRPKALFHVSPSRINGVTCTQPPASGKPLVGTSDGRRLRILTNRINFYLSSFVRERVSCSRGPVQLSISPFRLPSPDFRCVVAQCRFERNKSELKTNQERRGS